MNYCDIERLNKKELTLEERKDIISRWDKTGMLQNVDEAYTEECAVALETQRIYNEFTPDAAFYAQFKRISIPIIRRTVDGLVKNDLDVKCQGKVYSKWTEVPGYKFGDFRTRMKNIWSQHNLDEEAEMCAKMCEDIVRMLVENARMNYSRRIFLGPVACGTDGSVYINYELTTNIDHEQQ